VKHHASDDDKIIQFPRRPRDEDTSEPARESREALRSGWLTQGRQAQLLQARAIELIGVDHVVPVVGGGAALHLALLALDLAPGDDVLVPSLAPAALATLVVLARGHPVFCDIVSPSEPVLDPDDVARRITPTTRAIVVSHHGGYPASVERLRALADERGLSLVEDCIQALGATVGGRSVGTFGCFGAFALHGAPDGGGFVVAETETLALRLAELRSLTGRPNAMGFEHSVALTLVNDYRIDEAAAAAGVDQLADLPSIVRERRAIVDTVRQRAGRLGLTVAFAPEYLPAVAPACTTVTLLADSPEVIHDLAYKARRGHLDAVQPAPAYHALPFNAHVPRTSLAQVEEFCSRALELPATPMLQEIGLL
jgi:dTDP-4-amino-4,6-dideoxygalactose transaminase